MSIKRKWVNQPSTFQRHHEYHGVPVLYDTKEQRAYFLKGNVISMQMHPEALSDGWKAYPQGDLNIDKDNNKEGEDIMGINIGYTVRIKSNIDKSLYKNNNIGYVDSMEDCLGKTGEVIEIFGRKDQYAKVDTGGGAEYAWRIEDLELIPNFKTGDTVRIKNNVDKQLYEAVAGPGYNPDMDNCLGKTGTVAGNCCGPHVPVKAEGILRYWRSEDLELIGPKYQQGNKVKVIGKNTLGYGLEGVITEFLSDQKGNIQALEVEFSNKIRNLYPEQDLEITKG